MKAWLAVCTLLALTACDTMPDSFKAPPPRAALPPPPQLPLPPADGRAADIVIGDGFRYLVLYRHMDQARGNVVLRITRASAPELDYSDGLVAKRVAEAYCAQLNRPLNPLAGGKFSVPNAWMFEGGCG